MTLAFDDAGLRGRSKTREAKKRAGDGEWKTTAIVAVVLLRCVIALQGLDDEDKKRIKFWA